jgi:hypothetical protein
MTENRIDYVGPARRAGEFEFRRASYAEREAGLSLAEPLNRQATATPASIHWIDGLTGMAGWGNRRSCRWRLHHRATDYRRWGGGRARWQLRPRRAVLLQGEACGGVCIGAYAGATQESRRRVMMAAGITRMEFFAPLPCFARGATEDGKRSIASFGFHAIEDGLPDLWGQDPLPVSQEQAA